MAKLRNAFNRLLTRQGLLMVLVMAVFLEGTALVQYIFTRKGLREEADKRAESEMTIARLQIEKRTASVETTVHDLRAILKDALDKPDKVFDIFHEMLQANEDILDLAIGFVPDFYPRKGRWFEPLSARRQEGKIEDMVLGSEEHDYLKAEWYTRPLSSGRSFWTEPYFDESGAKDLVVTYSEPLLDSDGNPVGVVAADISLDWLANLMDNIHLYPNAYSTLASREGQMLAYPAETLAQGEIIRYETLLDKTGWRMNVSIPEEEIYKGSKQVGLIVTLMQLLGLLALFLIIRRTVKNTAALETAVHSKERIENELRIARNIQMAMLPKVFPPFPVIIPAKEVGGDLYDFFIRDERLFFCIGDVSGKGIPASLVMAVTRSLFRTVAGHEVSPQRIVTSMNESMSESNENDMFVTFFCGVLDLGTGRLRYCNAGHNTPVLLKKAKLMLPVESNIPLGVDTGFIFREQEIKLDYDDALFLYTDGLTEAQDSKFELFGEERMLKALSGRKKAKNHLENIQRQVSDCVGNAPQSDDLTMLFLHYLNDTMQTERHLILHNDIQQIPQLADFVGTIAVEKNLDQGLVLNLNLALEEAVTNVILYAYPPDTDGLVDIEAILHPSSLEFIISDSGKPFDPTKAPMPDTSLGLYDRPIGGLGIYMVKTIMDTFRYDRIDGKNILTMTKNI